MIIIISVAAFTNYLENKYDEGVCRGKIEQHFPKTVEERNRKKKHKKDRSELEK